MLEGRGLRARPGPRQTEWGLLVARGLDASSTPPPTPNPSPGSLFPCLPPCCEVFSSPAAASGPRGSSLQSRLLQETGAGNKGGGGGRRSFCSPSSLSPLSGPPLLEVPILRVTEALANHSLGGLPKAALWAIQGVTLSGPLARAVEVTPTRPHLRPWGWALLEGLSSWTEGSAVRLSCRPPT